MEEIVLKAITRKELSPREKIQLDNWLKESLQNRTIFNQLKLAMKYPGNDRIQEIKSQGLGNLKKKIAHADNNTNLEIKRREWPTRFLKIAATLILILSISIVIYKIREGNVRKVASSEVRLIEKTSLPGQKITISLSDGTIVKLNSDSRIVVPEHFDNDSRQVELIGEAFFDVNRDTQRPFIVKAGNLKVKVLGTSFNVRSYPDNSQPNVAVKTGKVAVNKIVGMDSVCLKPNEMVGFNSNGDLSKRLIDNKELVFGWTEQRLVFDETPIEEVFQLVSRWFGVEIIVEGKVKNKRPYTASYHNPTLEEVFKSLSHLYQFDYKNDEKRIIIN